MKTSNPVRDRWLGGVLRQAGMDDVAVSPEQLRALTQRIVTAAGPMLDQRAAPNRTLWDYVERWADTLIPMGAFTALAAAACLFWLSTIHIAEPAVGERTALIGAATNRVSSHDLVDLLVAPDTHEAAGAPAFGGGR